MPAIKALVVGASAQRQVGSAAVCWVPHGDKALAGVGPARYTLSRKEHSHGTLLTLFQVGKGVSAGGTPLDAPSPIVTLTGVFIIRGGEFAPGL